jgi:hypothetical protein
MEAFFIFHVQIISAPFNLVHHYPSLLLLYHHFNSPERPSLVLLAKSGEQEHFGMFPSCIHYLSVLHSCSLDDIYFKHSKGAFSEYCRRYDKGRTRKTENTIKKKRKEREGRGKKRFSKND